MPQVTQRRTVELVVIYNADSGAMNILLDIGHKLLSPETYKCDLCMLSHGYFAAKRQWRQFAREMGKRCEFLHRNEALDRYGVEAKLPAVFVRAADDRLQQCLSADAISACTTVEELIDAIRTKCLKISQESTA